MAPASLIFRPSSIHRVQEVVATGKKGTTYSIGKILNLNIHREGGKVKGNWWNGGSVLFLAG